jgi:cell division protease FtsH
VHVSAGESLWTPQGRPVVQQGKQSVKYTSALRDIRKGRVKEVVFAREGVDRALLVYFDGSVRYTQFATDDQLLTDALHSGSVTATYALPEPTPPRTSALDNALNALAMYWLPSSLLAGVYAVTVVMAKRKGDWEDREKLRRLEEEKRKGKSTDIGQQTLSSPGESPGSTTTSTDSHSSNSTQSQQSELQQANEGDPAFRGVGEKQQAGSGIFEDPNTKVKFNDVAGIGEAKVELEEVVEFFKQPERFRASGSKVPKGVLLSGPPGTGKTLLARAVAGEAGVAFFSITASEFVEMFVGVGAARVRDLFQKAKAKAPAIVFIDELDAIGRTRGGGGGGNEERDQTLNQLLSELDGFGTDLGIVVMAATNRPDVLDAALIRPGRFDRKVVIDQPDYDARLEILKVHASRKPLDDDVDLRELAFRAPGFQGAGLANLVNIAALLAAKDKRASLKQKDLDDALEMETMGQLTGEEEEWSEEHRRRLSRQQAAAAVAAKHLDRVSELELVTILPRESLPGGQLRLRFDEEKEQSGVDTREHLMERAALCLAGRAQEEIDDGVPSSLSEPSLAEARSIVTHMALAGGMFPETLGHRALAYPVGNEAVSEDVQARAIPPNASDTVLEAADETIIDALQETYDIAKSILQRRQPAVRSIAEELREQGTLSSSEVSSLLEQASETASAAT